jgi:hypothetical protein
MLVSVVPVLRVDSTGASRQLAVSVHVLLCVREFSAWNGLACVETMNGLVPIPINARWDGAVAVLRCGHCVALGPGWVADLNPLTRTHEGAVCWDGYILEFICTRHGVQVVADIVTRRAPCP